MKKLFNYYFVFIKFLLLFIMHSCAIAMAPVYFPYVFYQELTKIIECRISGKQNLNETLREKVYEPRTGFMMSNETPLYAVTGNDYYLPLTKKLLKNGADPNFSINHWSRIPLFHAMNFRAVKTVKALLKAGANPLVLIHESDKVSLIGWLCEDIRISNQPCFKESKKIVRLLLKYGADPNAPGHEGNYPLYELCLASKKARSIFILLLMYGADLSFKNKKGQDVIAAAEDSYSHGFSQAKPYGLTFIKDWQEGKIKLKKKKLR